MNLWEFLDRRLAIRALKKTGIEDPDQWLYDYLGAGRKTASGVPISEDTATTIPTVYRCVAILAGVYASTIARVMRRTEDGKEPARDHPVYRLIHDQPNPEIDSYTWRETGVAAELLWGNEYSFIEFGADGIEALWPIVPSRVTPSRAEGSGEIRYEVRRDEGGQPIIVPWWQMLHVKGLSFDGGLTGKSRIALLRESLGLASVLERHGATFFGNGARPGPVITSPLYVDKKAKDEIRRMWIADHNVNNMNSPVVLGEGMTVAEYQMPHDDAQFLETRKFQDVEIGTKAFGLPPWMFGGETTATNWGSGLEQQWNAFKVLTVLPMLRRREAAMNRVLFSDADLAAGYFIEFDIEGLLRADINSRMAAYQIGVTFGWLSPNEVREKENLNRVPGLDYYNRRLDAERVGSLGAGAPRQDAGLRTSFAGLYAQTWSRILKRGRQDWQRVEGGKLSRDEWRSALEAYAADSLAPIDEAWAASGGTPNTARPVPLSEPTAGENGDAVLHAAEWSLGG